MTTLILFSAAAVYWLCFAARAYLWSKEATSAGNLVGYGEKAALLLLTFGLVLYIGKLQIVDGQVHSEHYDIPVSFLLFAWAISAANLVSEVAYNNRWSAVFANFWTGLSLTVSPTAAKSFQHLFTYDLEWLSFHRLCFLLGYAFCMLAFPLVLVFCVQVWRSRYLTHEDREKMRPILKVLDRMSYRMVLWALPLLTAGILTEALLLLEVNRLPGPAEIWHQKQETLLALTAWILCGIYLHTRLFFGWRNLRSAALYLGGLGLLLLGHFSHLTGRHS